MQYGAPPYIATPMKKLLNLHFGNDRIISRHFSTTWPLRSPDLHPCDFLLWGYLKDIPDSTIDEWHLACDLVSKVYQISEPGGGKKGVRSAYSVPSPCYEAESLWLPYIWTSVRIYASECGEREIWLQLRRSDVFDKADTTPPMKQKSLFTSIANKKVGEPPYPDPRSN
ncbi:hypothetical protein AVEN_119727-1 [Araneus ventricosus]|uniref:Uncharacterized protein n=1 Tax=Araneus ventricosus TaxID=182803 RepID=A0A4Y2NS28_ARAVE|nr:hypothetical protein AVEN_119727-1 [Araneus ventricosus]